MKTAIRKIISGLLLELVLHILPNDSDFKKEYANFLFNHIKKL